ARLETGTGGVDPGSHAEVDANLAVLAHARMEVARSLQRPQRRRALVAGAEDGREQHRAVQAFDRKARRLRRRSGLQPAARLVEVALLVQRVAEEPVIAV